MSRTQQQILFWLAIIVVAVLAIRAWVGNMNAANERTRHQLEQEVPMP
jgi:membrane protein implicated in regulation of membrane protease activity